MDVTQETFDVDFSEKKEKPKGQIGELYTNVVSESLDSGKLDKEKEYTDPKSDEVKKAAKETMRERGEYLEKFNPEVFHRVIEIRGRARMVKELLEQAEKADNKILKTTFRNKARTMGDYSELIREAVDLFNTGYADIEDKVKEDKEAKAKRKEEDSKKIAEARERIAWLHSPKNPANYFINKEKQTRLDKIVDDRAERMTKEKKDRENNTVTGKMGWGNHRDTTNILKPIPGKPIQKPEDVMFKKPKTIGGFFRWLMTGK